MPDSNKNNNEKELYLAFCPKCKANFGDFQNKKCLCNNQNKESFSKNMTTIKSDLSQQKSKVSQQKSSVDLKSNQTKKSSSTSKHFLDKDDFEKKSILDKNQESTLNLETKDLEKSVNDSKQKDKSVISICTHKSFVSKSGGSIFKVSNIDTTGDICLSKSTEVESTYKEFKDESFKKNLKKVIDLPQEKKVKPEIINEIGDKICDLIEHKDKNNTKVYDVFILDKDGNVGSYELSRVEENTFSDKVLEELGYQKDDKNLSKNVFKADNVDVVFGDPVKNPGKVVWKFKSQDGKEESFDFDQLEREKRKEMLINIAKEAEQNPEEMFCLCKSVEIMPIKIPNFGVNLCACCKNKASNEVSNYKNQKCLLCESGTPEYENMPKKDMPISLQCNDEKYCKNSQCTPPQKEVKEIKDGVCYGCNRISIKKGMLKDKKDLFPCSYCLKISKNDDFVCCLTAEEKKQKKLICGDVTKISEKKFTYIASSSDSSRVMPLEVSIKKEKETQRSIKLPSQSSILSTQKVKDESAKSKNELEIIMLSRDSKEKEEEKKGTKSTDRSKITITFDDVPVKEKSSDSTSEGTSSKVSFLADENLLGESNKPESRVENEPQDKKSELSKKGTEVSLKSEDLTVKSMKEESKSQKETVSKESKEQSSASKKEEKSSIKAEESKVSSTKPEISNLSSTKAEESKVSSTKPEESKVSSSTKAEESKTSTITEPKESTMEEVKIKTDEKLSPKEKIETVLSTTEIKEIENAPTKISETVTVTKESTKTEAQKSSQSLLSKAIETFKSSLKSEDKSIKNEPISIISQVGSKKEKIQQSKSKADVEIIETTLCEDEFPIPKEPVFITNYKGSKILLNPQGRVARLIKYFEELEARKKKEKESFNKK